MNKNKMKMKIFRVNSRYFLLILNNYFVNFGQVDVWLSYATKSRGGEKLSGNT